MIPKIIHYSWISGDPYPENIQKCIDSWKEKLPDYQFINWNRDTFDFESSQWLKEAYEEQNYAYCSDYLRIYAIYNYGGIWLDTDVEVLKSFNDLLDLPYFFGAEMFAGYKLYHEMTIEAATFGAEKHNPFLGVVLKWYETHSFNDIKEDIYEHRLPMVMKKCYNLLYYNSNVNYIGIKDNIKDKFIYDDTFFNLFGIEYFSPLCKKYDGTVCMFLENKNTYSIHHFNVGWVDKYPNLFET
jgi:hypothetical protein